MQKLEEINQRVILMEKNRQTRSNLEVSPMVMTAQDLPMQIPLNTLDDLQLYEELLSADHTARADLVSYLRGIGGKDGKESIIHMVKALISKDVAQEYSFLGKKCFKELMICKSITVAAKKLALTEEEVSSVVGNSLRFS
ncbi:unnamed protein product [Darwinula stevensoni]|uniref:DUF4806 domain-containing protein n=1 Tax=Darwinula stevensoni TaxID=69355 RepID=A0A7R8XJ08_9CRUS|nr:unnamed protein product [Darwinula stevensoni]CAG0893938.1 unnamed protein product [Darwinula stevensoni]